MEPILVCDIVEYGLDCFGRAPQKYRVTHHLKKVYCDLDSAIERETDPDSKIELEICKKLKEEKREEQMDAGLACSCRYRLVYCRPEEATHLSLTGICGVEAPIEKCKRLSTVEWSEDRIKQERENAISDFWLKSHFVYDWKWE